MIKDCWHFSVWNAWNKKVYGTTLTQDNFTDDGKIHHQDTFFKVISGFNREHNPGKIEDTYYVKMVKDNKYYLLPKRYVDKLPVLPLKTEEIHLRRGDSQLWLFIKQGDSVKTPEKMVMSFKETIDTFNPLKHSNEKTDVFLKLAAFTRGGKFCVCGEVGMGKNASLTLMRQIIGKYSPKIKDVTRAAFWRYLYYNDYLNLDEFTTWKNMYVHDVEELISELGDESPDMDKFSLDKNKKLMKIGDLNDKSVTFTFNPPSEDNPNIFRDKFKNFDKIKDRFPMFLLEGKVVESLKRPNGFEAAQLMFDNFDDMCVVAGNVCYWYNNVNLSKHVNGWSRGGISLTRRRLGNFSRFLDVLDVYCESQEVFDGWLEWLNECLKGYSGLKVDFGNCVVEEEVLFG